MFINGLYVCRTYGIIGLVGLSVKKDTMVKNAVKDRIDVRFVDKRFLIVLDEWKKFCRFLDGGQTERLMEIIIEDLPKLKEKAIREHCLK